MTAFARKQADFSWGSLIWEIRSVNHRYLEPSFRLPDQFRHIETSLRDQLRNSLSRGKIEAQLKFLPNLSDSSRLPINEALLAQLSKAIAQVEARIENTTSPSPLDILKWPGIIQQQEEDAGMLAEESLALFRATLEVLSEHRAREGAELEAALANRLAAIDSIIADIRSSLPVILAGQQNRLREQISELAQDVDASRLEAELVIIIQKADIEEELDRLEAHVKEIRHVLSRNEPVGRRLDFLLQELNREANTICSKAVVTETTLNAVELKVLIEQMREQVQNIE
jgi:uncharacterized protein (TIGR00255 family)